MFTEDMSKSKGDLYRGHSRKGINTPLQSYENTIHTIHTAMKFDEKNEENLEKEVWAPYAHLLQVQETILCTKIFWSFNHWFKVPEHLVNRVVDTLTIMVNGIIMIDDIQDNSLIRRGLPTAQCVYGLPLTINNAVLVLAEAMQKAVDLIPNGLGGKLMADTLNEMMIGQGTEIYWRDNFICPTEESYKKMHQQKTGAFIKLGVQLLQVLGENNEDYDHIVQLLGYYSQLRDDYCNLCAKELNEDSSFCEDLIEGKFTLPIIHASKTSARREVLRILQKRTSDVMLKKYCLNLLEQAGSLQYTRDKLGELDRDARAEVSRLGGNPLLESVLDALNSWKDDIMFVKL